MAHKFAESRLTRDTVDAQQWESAVALVPWLAAYRPHEYPEVVREYDWYYGPVLEAGEIGRRLRLVLQDRPPKDGGRWTPDRLGLAVRGFDRGDVEALVSGAYELPPPALVRGVAEAIGVPGGWLWDRAVARGTTGRPVWRYALDDRMWQCLLRLADLLRRITPSWARG